MPIVNLGGKQVGLNEEGCLEDPDDWDEKVAEDLANAEHIDEMNENHWEVINFMREYFGKFRLSPQPSEILKELNLSIKQFYQLFPSGPLRACRIAGLPLPPYPCGCQV